MLTSLSKRIKRIQTELKVEYFTKQTFIIIAPQVHHYRIIINTLQRRETHVKTKQLQNCKTICSINVFLLTLCASLGVLLSTAFVFFFLLIFDLGLEEDTTWTNGFFFKTLSHRSTFSLLFSILRFTGTSDIKQKKNKKHNKV